MGKVDSHPVGIYLPNAATTICDKKYTEQDNSHKNKILQEMRDESFTYIFLEGTDKRKYGSLIQTLTSDYLKGYHNHPTTLSTAIQQIGAHTFDNTIKKNNDKDKTHRHDDKKTPNESQPLSFAQMAENTCYVCDKKGHKATDCYHKNSITKEDWWINKQKRQAENMNVQINEMTNNNNQQQTEQNCSEQNLEERTTEWTNMQSATVIGFSHLEGNTSVTSIIEKELFVR